MALDLQSFRLEFRGGVAVKKILIVDDSQAEVHLIQTMLQKGGFQTVGLFDSTKTEETIEEVRPNVILLDVVMPQRNGFQVCRDLKGHQAYSKIPVILVTSKAAPSDRYWGEQQGANGFVAKPFTPEELLGAVNVVLEAQANGGSRNANERAVTTLA
jgi:twitching motility two-component system response regulator PilH